MKVYKSNIIEALGWLSNYDYQKIAWFPNNIGIMNSYAESVMAVFDDTGLVDALNNKKIVFGKEADDALRELEHATEAIDELSMSDDEIIDSIAMAKVRAKASRALALVESSDDSESTVEIIK